MYSMLNINKRLVGVDDPMIDQYDAQLAEVYKRKYPVEDGPVPAIQFKGLKDIFMLNPHTLNGLESTWLDSVVLPHPVSTEINHDSEICRGLMLGVAEADRDYIRQCIVDEEPHALQLYRGQTRFMLEDLAMLPSVKNLSNKQKKKTAANVAQEMMSRNQAYSNLTELLLPNYVRLSIHAHPNKGPKFAVRLLPKNMVRPIQCLETRHEPVPAYEFQIPTPWHNTIIKVEGDDLLYLARADVAKAAMSGPDFEGMWVNGPNGAHFSLWRKGTNRPKLSLITEDEVLDEKPCMDLVSPKDVVDAHIQMMNARSMTMDFGIKPLQRRTTAYALTPTTPAQKRSMTYVVPMAAAAKSSKKFSSSLKRMWSSVRAVSSAV
jgi:pyoverdine/dityrosine biosynthesis protein Dit1